MSDSITTNASTMTYQVGTMFRLYNSDKSTHYTAIMLKDGKVLELKNPDGVRGGGTKFNSFDEFMTERQMEGGELVVDTSKACGMPVGEDTHGFKYPRGESVSWWRDWPRWFYNVVSELAPHLLTREDVRSAYNSLVEALEECDKKRVFIRSTMLVDKSHRYSKNYLCWNEAAGKFKGYPIYFSGEEYGSCYVVGYSARLKAEEYEELRTAILKPYKDLYDMAHEELYARMEGCDRVARLEGEIRRKVKAMGVVKRRIDRLESQIRVYQKYYNNMDQDVCKMRGEIAQLKGMGTA